MLDYVDNRPDEIHTFIFEDNRNDISRSLAFIAAKKVQSFFQDKGYYAELSEERGYNQDVSIFYELRVSKNPINQ